MESMQGGDLYQLQQEAIMRARETAKKAVPHETPPTSNKPSLLPAFSSDSWIVVAVLAVLLLNGCDDMMLVLALALILIL